MDALRDTAANSFEELEMDDLNQCPAMVAVLRIIDQMQLVFAEQFGVADLPKDPAEMPERLLCP